MKPAVPREIVCGFFVLAGCCLKVDHDRVFQNPFKFIICCPPDAGQCIITTLFNTLEISNNTNIIVIFV